MWWIPEQKHYKPETEEWCCPSCWRRTPLERNPKWGGEYRGEGEAPEWFVRCADCKSKHYQSSGYECPECGYSDCHEDSVISYGKPVSNWAMSMEYGGNPIDWEETHHCPICGTKFTFTNSNY